MPSSTKGVCPVSDFCTGFAGWTLLLAAGMCSSRKEISLSSFTHGVLAHLNRKQYIPTYFHFLLSMTSVKYKRHEQWVIKSSPFVDRDVIRQAQTKRWVIKKGTPLVEMAQKNVPTVRFSRHEVLLSGCTQIIETSPFKSHSFIHLCD